MSEKAKTVFAQISRDVKDEVGRLADHGASELAAALFSGHAFLPYGSGQRRNHEVDHQPTRDQPDLEHEIER